MTEENISGDNALEIYISYNRLNAGELGQYLINLSFIANKISEDYLIRFSDPEYEDQEPPVLDVDSLHTGNSITIKLKEGWKPSTRLEDGEFILYIPKMLGVPLMVAASLVTAAITYQEITKNAIEIDIAKIELQLKQRELNKVLAEERQKADDFQSSVTNYINNKIPEVKPVLLDTVKAIVGSPNINQFRVNGIEIKGNIQR